MWLTTQRATWNDIYTWCRHNVKGGWRVNHLSYEETKWIQFYEKADAMLFRLTWAGNL